MLDVVKRFSNLTVGIQRHASDIHVQDHEELLSLVRLNNILDDVVLVLDVDSQHLHCLALVLYHLTDLRINDLPQVLNPDVFRRLVLLNDS